MTTAWFHCFSGIAGDMALGALLDAGAGLDEVRSILGRLPLDGWSLEAEPVLRSGIAGTKIHVHHHDDGTARTAADIDRIITDAGLPERVEERARRIFAVLAAAEGHLHRQPPESVHFHEVGGIDAIVDVVGTCAALEVLGVDRVTTSPVAVGLGMVRAAHGVIPNPAPAVVRLLHGLPTRGVDVALELTTPTGAAIIAALAEAHGPMPPLSTTVSGFGAGTNEIPDRPNLTQVVLGEPISAEPDGQPVMLLETNVDDATGEVLAHTIAALIGAGAHDAWITPILMKKGRPAHLVSALCDPALTAQIADVLTAQTGSFGIRGSRLERWPANRRMDAVEVDGHPVRVKVGPGRAKIEFDDAAAVATRTGRAVRDVIGDAETRWRTEQPAVPLEEGVVPAGTSSDTAGGTDTFAEPIAEIVQEPDRPIPHHHHHSHDHDHDDHHHGADHHGHDHGEHHHHAADHEGGHGHEDHRHGG